MSDAASDTAAIAFTHMMSWLTSSFAKVIKDQKAITLTTTVNSQAANSTSTASIPVSADFAFAGVILQPSLLRMQQPATTATTSLTADDAAAVKSELSEKVTQKAGPATKGLRGTAKAKLFQQSEQTKAHALPMPWATAAHGAAKVIGVMAEKNIYRPTEDSTRSHRELLTAVADAALGHAQHIMAADTQSGSHEYAYGACNHKLHFSSLCTVLCLGVVLQYSQTQVPRPNCNCMLYML